MSSTNRGAQRSEHDYYVTPVPEIVKFLQAWDARTRFAGPAIRILDPCAGGNDEPVQWLFKEGKTCSHCGFQDKQDDCGKHNGKSPVIFDIPLTPMSYPAALRAVLGAEPQITSMDIRVNSPAQFHRDYLNDPLPLDGPPNLIISNPPFGLAQEFIRHSLVMVAPGGYVVMLLRLNFFGSAKRKPFFEKQMPVAAYVHHERMGFTPDGKTDSIEYMHAVWQQGVTPAFCELRII